MMGSDPGSRVGILVVIELPGSIRDCLHFALSGIFIDDSIRKDTIYFAMRTTSRQRFQWGEHVPLFGCFCIMSH